MGFDSHYNIDMGAAFRRTPAPVLGLLRKLLCVLLREVISVNTRL